MLINFPNETNKQNKPLVCSAPDVLSCAVICGCPIPSVVALLSSPPLISQPWEGFELC